MLCGCCGDRWPIRCLMANEVRRGFYNVGLLCSSFGQFINVTSSFITMFVWVLTLWMVILWWDIFERIYYLGYEELI